VSKKDPTMKELEKRVRSMTMLTTKKLVPTCLAVPFDAKNPLREVSVFNPNKYSVPLIFVGFLLLIFLFLAFIRLVIGSSFFGFTSPLLEEVSLVIEIVSFDPEAPRPLKVKAGMRAKILQKEPTQLSHLPLLILKTKIEGKRENAKMI
jgi:hypothetical protein